MPKIVFERLKVIEKQQILAGTTDTSTTSTLDSNSLTAEVTTAPSGAICIKTLDHHCHGLTILECDPQQQISGSTIPINSRT